MYKRQGLIESIFDGIQRPLEVIYQSEGDRITRGIDVPKLNREKKWAFVPVAKVGDEVSGGDVIGTVQETPAVLHKIMVPPGKSGVVEWVFSGEATITEPVYKLKEADGTVKEYPMLQTWPVRKARPYKSKLAPDEPMVTGQRVIDTPVSYTHLDVYKRQPCPRPCCHSLGLFASYPGCCHDPCLGTCHPSLY